MNLIPLPIYLISFKLILFHINFLTFVFYRLYYRLMNHMKKISIFYNTRNDVKVCLCLTVLNPS